MKRSSGMNQSLFHFVWEYLKFIMAQSVFFECTSWLMYYLDFLHYENFRETSLVKLWMRDDSFYPRKGSSRCREIGEAYADVWCLGTKSVAQLESKRGKFMFIAKNVELHSIWCTTGPRFDLGMEIWFFWVKTTTSTKLNQQSNLVSNKNRKLIIRRKVRCK